jgi:polyhydroxybutyrate depolymerase
MGSRDAMKRLVIGVVVLVVAMAWARPAAQRSADPADATRTLQVGGRARSYILHVPARLPAGPRPLVLAFHGGAGNARSMVRLTGLDEKADREGFVVAYPNGTGRLAPILTWNAGACCGYAVAQHVDDTAFVRAVLDDIDSVVRVDPDRIYATGISNGGQMAYRLAAEMSDRIAAIAPVAGSLEVPIGHPARPVSVMHFHGTDDDHLPFDGGRGQRSIAGVAFQSVAHSVGSWVQADGCRSTPDVEAMPDRADDGTTVERRTYPGCRDGSAVVLFVIHGGGHTWPGRPAAGWLLGVTTMDISATDLMWEFFAKHPRRVR